MLTRSKMAESIARDTKTVTRALKELVKNGYILLDYAALSNKSRQTGIPIAVRFPKEKMEQLLQQPNRTTKVLNTPHTLADSERGRQQLDQGQQRLGETLGRLSPHLKGTKEDLNPQIPVFSATPTRPTVSTQALPVTVAAGENGMPSTLSNKGPEKPSHPLIPLADDLKTFSESVLREVMSQFPTAGQGGSMPSPSAEVPLSEPAPPHASGKDVQSMTSSLTVYDGKNCNINKSVIEYINKNNLTRDLLDLSPLERLERFQTFYRSFSSMKEKAKQLQQGGLLQAEALIQAHQALPIEHQRPVARLSHELQTSHWLNATNLSQALEISLTYERSQAQGRVLVLSREERGLYGNLLSFMTHFFGKLEVITEQERARAEWKTPVSSDKPQKELLAITPAQAHRIALRLNAERGRLTGEALELLRSSPRELLSQFLYHIASWEPTQIVCENAERRITVTMDVGLKMMREWRWSAPAGWRKQACLAEQKKVS